MRIDGGSLRRFETPKAHGDRRKAGLASTHPAVTEGRTLFPKSLVHPAVSPRLLVSGHNQAKIGATVKKGPWAGMPIYTLTLEERATCPASCPVWNECYGNGMPFARRHMHGPALEARLATEVADRLDQHRRVAVRLHILGDFYSPAYARMWLTMLDRHEGLHLFGFTAHAWDSDIGAIVGHMNHTHPSRCAIRFSVAAPSGRRMEATVLWGGACPPEVIPCPAQAGGTACCATCALCWAPAAADHTIGFVGHGAAGRRT